MTKWTELPLAALDFESTSADPLTARIVSACVLRVDGGDVRARNYIANPGVPIPPEASAIHGLTDEYVQKHGRPHEEVVAEVASQVRAVFAEGRALAIYNASYDASLLAAHDPTFAVGNGLIVDPFLLDKQYDRFRKGSRKLSAVCIHYGMRLDDAHDAEADALAAARLAWKMPRVYPHLAIYTAAELMEHQAIWYADQAASLIKYLEREGRDFSGVRTQWPIQTAPEVQAA